MIIIIISELIVNLFVQVLVMFTAHTRTKLVFPKHIAIAWGTKNYFAISALYHRVLQGTVIVLSLLSSQSHHFLAAQYCMPPLEEVWVSSSLLDLLLVSC